MTGLSLGLADEAMLTRLAAAIAATSVVSATVVWLTGEVGAGKTALTRAVLRQLGVVGAIKSPTYALVEVYPLSGLYFYHFDWYRLQAADEIYLAGLEEYFHEAAACWIEWPERGLPFTPAADLVVSLTHQGADAPSTARQFDLTARSARGETCLNNLMSHLCAARS